MTSPWMPETVGVCVRWIASAIKGSATAARAVLVATLSLSEVLLQLISDHLAEDISQIKDALIRREQAKTGITEAEALRKLAEAADAANRATLRNRRDRLALLELDAKRLENAKTQAEIDALEVDAATRRLQAVAEGKARLIEAVSKLRQEGGAVFFDQENLARILEMPMKSISPLPNVPGASVRLLATLRELGFTSIAELSQISEEDFLKCRNAGETTLHEAQQRLAEIGERFLPG